ncbi:MAG: efflux RND transporter periplasmic adaptor subunit, partial [Deltaproteobacteria bacterium]|nr:efflux RND transporter periplasmic adaptor subunit [Deltaproteobacteria bacterium]
MRALKNTLNKARNINLSHKTAIALIVLLLITGLAFKLTFIPSEIMAQTTTCDHDHHPPETAEQTHDDAHEHELHEKNHEPEHKHEESQAHEHIEHDNHEQHQGCEHHDHEPEPGLEPAHKHTSEADTDHTGSQCSLGHDHAAGNPEIAGDCSGDAIHMSPTEMKQFGIVVEKAVIGDLEIRTQARGEVLLNRDRMAQIVPRVSGTVVEIHSTLGDFVEKGETMAIIESQELADAKTAYLNAIKHLELARTISKREQKLRRKKINSEQEYLSAGKNLAEAEIIYSGSKQRLKLLGISQAELNKLPSEPLATLARLIVRSPFSGDVIKKNIVLGEVLSGATPIFTVANLDSVWVDLDIYTEDAVKINKGEQVIIFTPVSGVPISAVIDYMAPLIVPQTRTIKARIIFDNRERKL